MVRLLQGSKPRPRLRYRTKGASICTRNGCDKLAVPPSRASTRLFGETMRVQEVLASAVDLVPAPMLSRQHPARKTCTVNLTSTSKGHWDARLPNNGGHGVIDERSASRRDFFIWRG